VVSSLQIADRPLIFRLLGEFSHAKIEHAVSAREKSKIDPAATSPFKLAVEAICRREVPTWPPRQAQQREEQREIGRVKSI
jgi:hypothetical protein